MLPDPALDIGAWHGLDTVPGESDNVRFAIHRN